MKNEWDDYATNASEHTSGWAIEKRIGIWGIWRPNEEMPYSQIAANMTLAEVKDITEKFMDLHNG